MGNIDISALYRIYFFFLLYHSSEIHTEREKESLGTFIYSYAISLNRGKL